MREIKFRAWDKERGVMICLNPASSSFLLMTWDGLVYRKGRLKDFHLMQYTGLHDKAGKEIYEGDLVEILAEDENINRFTVKYGIARRQMDTGWVCDIPSFYFEHISNGFKAYPIAFNYKGMHDLQMMEVIGNIYENPELVDDNPEDEGPD